MEIVHLLQNEGAEVLACEPFKPDAKLEGVTIVPSIDDAIRTADVLLLLVKHTEFTKLDPEALLKKTNSRIVVDAVDGWAAAAWKKAGFRVMKLGSGKTE